MASPDRHAIARMKADGRMCFSCARPLDMGVGALAWTGGVRYCDRCGRSQRVGLTFRVEHGVWHVNFVDQRSRMTIVPTWRVQDPEKIRELVRRTSTRFNLADNQAFDLGLSNGRGAIDIELTAEQLRSLKERHR
jgi:hypothetical protein